VGIPSLTPKPVEGIPSWFSPSGHTNGLPYIKENYVLVAMMLLTIRASLSSMKRIEFAFTPVVYAS